MILPKKKPQKWSTGMAPGEYGGGPATVKPRKYWWGKEDRDPVGNTDDFIWNKDFLPHMERVIANGGADVEPTITRLAPVCISISSSFTDLFDLANELTCFVVVVSNLSSSLESRSS